MLILSILTDDDDDERNPTTNLHSGATLFKIKMKRKSKREIRLSKELYI